MICKICGKIFEPTYYQRCRMAEGFDVFCSKKCVHSLRKKDRSAICANCGKKFLGGDYRRKYCCMECKNDALRKEVRKVCANCGKEFVLSRGQMNYQKDNAHIFYCSRRCAAMPKKTRPTKGCCKFCGKEFVLSVGQQKKIAKGLNVFCTQDCANKGKTKRGCWKTKEEKIETKRKLAEKHSEIQRIKNEKRKKEREEQLLKGLSKNKRYSHIKPEQIVIVKNKEKFVEFANSIPFAERTYTEFSRKLGELGNNNAYGFQNIAKLAKDFNVEEIFNKHAISRGEKEIREYLESLGMNFSCNDRQVLDGFEIDIYIPNKKIAIEYNGEYWHRNGVSKGRDNIKYKKAESLGIKFIQIWESEWINKKAIVKEMLRNKLGVGDFSVFARDCVIVYEPKCSWFLDVNHLQGADKHFFSIGLTYNNVLVAVMTFRKSRNNKEVELSRYATSCRVVGGFTKLLSHCGLSGEIVSYSDNRLSDGGMYEKNGWELIKEIAPDYRVFYKGEFYHKSAWKKELIKRRFPCVDFGDKTEWEMEDEVGALRCWDCGKKKWGVRL